MNGLLAIIVFTCLATVISGQTDLTEYGIYADSVLVVPEMRAIGSTVLSGLSADMGLGANVWSGLSSVQDGFFGISHLGGLSGFGRRGLRQCRHLMCSTELIRQRCKYTPILRTRRRGLGGGGGGLGGGRGGFGGGGGGFGGGGGGLGGGRAGFGGGGGGFGGGGRGFGGRRRRRFCLDCPRNICRRGFVNRRIRRRLCRGNGICGIRRRGRGRGQLGRMGGGLLPDQIRGGQFQQGLGGNFGDMLAPSSSIGQIGSLVPRRQGQGRRSRGQGIGGFDGVGMRGGV